MPGGWLAASRWRPGADIADLAWMRTPLTVAQARALGHRADGDAYLPVSGLDLAHAADLAAAFGGRLPTSQEWEWMAGGGLRRYPWGEAEPNAWHANLRGVGPGAVTPVGQFPEGRTPHGLLDVAGNVWEWTTSSTPGVAVVRGGSYNSHGFYARCAYTNEIPESITSPGIGMRVVRDL